MTSREIAQITGKRHDHVLRDCDVLNEHYERLALPKIEQGYYLHPNTGNQKHREYTLNKAQILELVSGYSAELRIRIVRALEEKDQQLNLFEFMAVKPTTSRK
ncbi:Rha family transcriptional regulator [Draconibacterium sp. IB214405]|uniref:Rha family transcriptional regulator n=1 Tax=Draconibacterium sp. IB214405 TaxID=3097352 RepID=UPI002A102366|nr:Rha family transcriptional regulator [Draconibacterium sp. IB214405]MDX8340553.1 Rha family transcriptional regulator [Draconibacterium sp. IB214405]